uniref:Conotoxin n=1 Tax=Conus andremenezi TaxID=1077466 RepID=A0A291C1S0_9COND|nr:conotoxin [Conus andremenezi]
MSKVGVVLLIFLVLLSLAALQNGDDPRQQRGEKQSPQRDNFRSTLRKYSHNIQRRCRNGTSSCTTCARKGKDCMGRRGGGKRCGKCVPRGR